MSLLKRIEKGGSAGVDAGNAGSSPTPIRPKSPQKQIRRAAPSATQKDAFKDLKERIQDRLVAELDPAMDVSRTDEVRRTIQDIHGARSTFGISCDVFRALGRAIADPDVVAHRDEEPLRVL